MAQSQGAAGLKLTPDLKRRGAHANGGSWRRREGYSRRFRYLAMTPRATLAPSDDDRRLERRGTVTRRVAADTLPRPMHEKVEAILRCPRCRGALLAERADTAVTAYACDACRVRYPVRDGVANFTPTDAEALAPDAPR